MTTPRVASLRSTPRSSSPTATAWVPRPTCSLPVRSTPSSLDTGTATWSVVHGHQHQQPGRWHRSRESIDAMRQSIPRAAARIKNRAITLHDYADMALQVPGVAKSVAHGTVYTAVRVKIAPTGGQGDRRVHGEAVRRCRGLHVRQDHHRLHGLRRARDDGRAMAGRVHPASSSTSRRATTARRCGPPSTPPSVRCCSFDNVDFGTRVTIGQIYRAALAVQGVEWAELTWLNTTEPVDDTDPGEGDTSDCHRCWRVAARRHAHDGRPRQPSLPPQQRHQPDAFAFNINDDDGLNKLTDADGPQGG